MLQVSNLSMSFAGSSLFENISFNINKSEKVGLIGRNGSGKSTLFKLILKELSPDSGSINLSNNYKLGSLSQFIKFKHSSVLSETLSILPEDLRLDHYRAQKILFGLGFSEEDMQKDPKLFSGGYQIRINLCKVLLNEPNLLLLDEPTNYLDLVSMRWLKKFLINFAGEVILITHDQEFMNSVTTHTMGIYQKKLKKIKGSTKDFYDKVSEEQSLHIKTQKNIEAKKQHLESFITRFQAKASKASLAKSKQKQLDKLQSLDDLEVENTAQLSFNYSEIQSKELLEVLNLTHGFSDKELFTDVSFKLHKNDKLAIIGANGKGKSTLLNILAHEIKANKGSFQYNSNVSLAHFGQTNVLRLNPENDIYTEVSMINDQLTQSQIRAICAYMLFKNDDVYKKIKVLSGGEKSRVLLAKILATEVNLLLLDEPTNHLDMQTVEMMTQELERFQGALILVTHSEDMLHRVANKLLVFKNNNFLYFEGRYQDFLDKIGFEEQGEQRKAQSSKRLTKKDEHILRQEIIKQRAKYCKPLEEKMIKTEKLIQEDEKKLSELELELEKLTIELNNDSLYKCTQEIKLIQEKIEESFNQLEKLESELIAHQEKFQVKLDELKS